MSHQITEDRTSAMRSLSFDFTWVGGLLREIAVLVVVLAAFATMAWSFTQKKTPHAATATSELGVIRLSTTLVGNHVWVMRTNGDIRRINPCSGDTITSLDTKDAQPRAFATSPDGESFAVAQGDDYRLMWVVEGRPLPPIETTREHLLCDASLSRGGRRLLVSTLKSDLIEYRADAEDPATPVVRGKNCLIARFSTDASAIVVATSRNSVQILDGQTFEIRKEWSAPPSRPTHLTVNGDGHFAVTYLDGEVVVGRIDGDGLASTRLSTLQLSSASFSPSGEYLVVGGFDKTARLLRTSDLSTIREWTGHLGPIRQVAVMPEGDTVLTGGLDGQLRAWSMTTGNFLYEIQP